MGAAMASLMSGAGLRLLECLRLRVPDVDIASGQITVRDGKGFQDRRMMAPVAVKDPLQDYLARVRHLQKRDLAEGLGGPALRAGANAASAWGWQ